MNEQGQEYNFEHLDSRLVLQEVGRAWEGSGITPGVLAPDFELPRADSGFNCVRLSSLRGKPVLLHFVSYSSAVTAGSVDPMKRLHSAWEEDAHFLDILVRQAHPGPNARVYHSFEEKMENARAYAVEEKIPYPVLVDNLEGEVHRMYGGLPDASYLIDADGRVSFYNHWTHAPTLHRALTELQKQSWTGVVNGGIDKTPHMLPAIADGWRGLQRGFPQSLIEAEKSLPGSGIGPFVGHYLKPVLGPIALRSEPLPTAARVMMALAAGFALAAIIAGLSRRRQRAPGLS